MDENFLNNLTTVGSRFASASSEIEQANVVDIEVANKRKLGHAMVSIADSTRKQQIADRMNPDHGKDELVKFFTDVMNDVGTDKDDVVNEVMKRIGAPQTKRI